MNYPELDKKKSHDILGHMINGAVASAIAAGTINFRKVKNNEATTAEALRETVKRTSQGAIATGAAMATADYLGQKGGLLKALTVASVGVAGIYAMEVLDDKLQKKKISITNDNNTIELKGDE